MEYYTFKSWADTYDKLLEWNDSERLIVFVHNLGYEIEAIIRNPCGHEIGELFATDTHAPLKFVIDGQLEFRCSYRLTNKSLADCAKDVKMKKQEMDYDIVRRPGDPLTEEEENYCKMDVLIMDAKIRQLEDQEGLHFWEFPLTNTAFVRNELRKVMRRNKKNYSRFRGSALSYPYFMLMRDAFQGGYTHANYMYTGKVMDGVDSFDFGSAYPFAMLVHKFPLSGFHRVDHCTVKDLNYLLNNDNVLFVCNVVLHNTKGLVKCKLANTYISYSKALAWPLESVVIDNGRIQAAEYIEVTCTSLDYKIIQQVYEYDQIAIKKLIWSNAGYLPDEMLLCMIKYYEQKQSLKHVKGQENNYLKAKNRVNSFFGMTVTSPLHDEIEIVDSVDWKRQLLDYDDRPLIEEKLNEFYKNRNNFLPYQWGVFIPAWTRYHLWNDIIIPNDKRVIYCDTDSAKVFDTEKCMPFIDKYNAWANQAREERLKAIGFDRPLPDLGVFDWETEKTGKVKFKTLGAKKYLVQDQAGRFAMTVAGLCKDAVDYIESFDDFRPGTVFSPKVSGRTVSRFITNEVATYDNGGCYIEDTTYRLTLSDSYERLLAERDGLTVEEVQRQNSDLYIDVKGRRHLGEEYKRFTDEEVDLTVILTKRNLYTVKETKRYDEV